MFNCVDIIFDRYYNTSIKSNMRKKCVKKATPVRREIQDRNVPLPQKWDNFIAHSQNKADFGKIFLSQQLMIQAPSQKTIVVAGGFSKEQQV